MGRRDRASILHVDLDAFYAAVEQRDKPSLRGKPVIVGGVGHRGVVATASYEARAFGVRSAMAVTQARALCPHGAYLVGRFVSYREASAQVMECLHELSPLVEPLSLDEAFVDLAADPRHDLSPGSLTDLGRELKQRIHARTQLTASVGLATSKLIAKIASDLGKPDGLVLVPPGTELDLLHPMSVRTIWGVGPATADRLARLGVRTVADLAALTEDELVATLGNAHGHLLHQLARAEDDRPVTPDRESKSVSIEDTFDRDVTDRRVLAGVAETMARRVCGRLSAAALSGRTVTLKVRLADFTTLSRSQSLPAPTDDAQVVARLARRLLDEVDTSDGVRLLGVGMSGLADWVQEDLFAADHGELGEPEPPEETSQLHETRAWLPGQDVVHDTHGPGWVWGSGAGVVTVRFETRHTGPGPVRTFRIDDNALASAASQPAEPTLTALSGASQDREAH